jgi:hypothetical protein
MKLFWMLLSLVAVAGSMRGAVFTNDASADAFVRGAAPTLNYGGAGALSVSGPNATNAVGVTNGVFDSFIRFNTGAMVTNFDLRFGTNNWFVTSAKLRVSEQGAPNNALFNRGVGAFEIRWMAQTNWAEGTGVPINPTGDGVVYNDEPALLNGGTDISLGTFTNAGVNGSLNFTLALPAAFVGAMKAGGEVGLFLTALDPEAGFTFNSRDFSTIPARPFLEVSGVPRPIITAINLSGTNVVLAAANGAAGGTYFVLASANLALPLGRWAPIATNLLTTDGDFAITVTNAVNLNPPPQQFFILQTR